MVNAIRDAEEEQIEALKAWWAAYGRWVIRIFVVALSVSLLVRYYFHHEKVILQNASLEYDLLLNAYNAEQKTDNHASTQKPEDTSPSTVLHATRLMTEFKNTPYATMAAMIMAKQAEDQGDFDKALTTLNQVTPKEKNLRALWHLRKAKILQSKADIEGALAVLTEEKSKAFQSAIEELKGDLLLAKGDTEAAKKAYDAAIMIDEQPRPLVQLKRDDLN